MRQNELQKQKKKKRGRTSAEQRLHFMVGGKTLLQTKKKKKPPPLALVSSRIVNAPQRNAQRFVLTRSVSDIVRASGARPPVQERRRSSHSRTQTQPAFGPNKVDVFIAQEAIRAFPLRAAASRSFPSAAVKGLISPRRRFCFHPIEDVYLAAASDHFSFLQGPLGL